MSDQAEQQIQLSDELLKVMRDAGDRVFYVTARDQCDIFSTAPQPYEAGHAYYGSAYFPSEEAEPYRGFLKAIDPATGEIKWKFEHTSPTWSGVLSTAGGLVFIAATNDHRFRAFDSRTGRELWAAEIDGSGHATPMTYQASGWWDRAIPLFERAVAVQSAGSRPVNHAVMSLVVCCVVIM